MHSIGIHTYNLKLHTGEQSIIIPISS